MWKIDKTFEFCYGHRVWTQTLDGRFSSDLQCVCRHLHGHEAKVQVFLEGTQLNESSMVTDFRHLEWLKAWLNKHVDHQFIIHKNDPLFPILFPENQVRLKPLLLGYETLTGTPLTKKAGDTLEMLDEFPNHLVEMFEGVLVVDFVPTSESLSKWLFGLVEAKMTPLFNVRVAQVDWWETPKSRSSYIKN
jgi:6-pyruvoyltetrahydropterin/6-carboxytetrahydropterin synthase